MMGNYVTLTNVDEKEFDDVSDDVLNDSYWSDNYNGGDGEDFPDM